MINGIILAGGESRRFGSDKGLALLHQKPLVEWVIETLRPLCHDLIISANSAAYDGYGHRVIPDVTPGKGPMMGIFSALTASETEHNLVLSVDTPLVSTALLQFVLDNKGGALIAVPQTGINHYEPLIGYYSKSSLPFMEAAFRNENYKLPDLFRNLQFKGIDLNEWPLFQPSLLSNINTLSDLSLLQP